MTVGPIFAGAIASRPVGVPGPIFAGQVQTIPLAIPGPVFSGQIDVLPFSRQSAIYATTARDLRTATQSSVTWVTASALRSAAQSAIHKTVAQTLREGTQSAPYSATTDSYPAILVGTPFRYLRDAVPQAREGTPFRFVRDLALVAREGTPFRFLRTFAGPAQTFGGTTSNRIPGIAAAQVFGGPTIGVSPLIPPRSFGAPTSGVVAFTAVPPPDKLVATPVAVGTIVLTWTPTLGAATGWRIERSLNGQGNFAPIATVGPTTFIYADRTAQPLEVYDYIVIGFNEFGDGAPSNVATARAPGPGLPLPPIPPERQPFLLEFLSSGTYGLEKDLDGNVGGTKF